MKNHIVKSVTVHGMIMPVVICICIRAMVVFVIVINGTVAGYRYNYVFGMMVMGNQVVSQKDGEAQVKKQRYVRSGLQAFL
jgi:hypothetical protein